MDALNPYSSCILYPEEDGGGPEGEKLLPTNIERRPNAAWIWAMQNTKLSSADKDFASLRSWACVMWDDDRLERWGIL